jgi:hypothetical protein
LITPENNKTKILVCYYQPWELPKENIFFPIQAGKAISGFNLKIQGDDTGDKKKKKNETFSEFTAWYWAWKNLKTIYMDIEYIGLSHYRRFFALNKPYEDFSQIFKNYIPRMENYEELIKQKLDNNDIILVKPAMYGCDLKTQYAQFHNIEDYYKLKEIVHDLHPEYDETFINFFENNNTMSLYCMFITRYEIFNKYFEWLFPLLSEIEKRIDVSKYDTYQKRVLAFCAERLLNIYVLHNKLKIVYEPIYCIIKEINMDSNFNIKRIVKKIIKFIIPNGIFELYRMRKEKKEN